MTPTRPADYFFWVIASVLLGLVLALRRVAQSRPDVAMTTGGLGTVLAVGCPVCNKLVVALLGVSGALGIFAPLQPVLGAASLIVLVVALRRELTSMRSSTCTVAVLAGPGRQIHARADPTGRDPEQDRIAHRSGPVSDGAASGEQVRGTDRQSPLRR